MTFLIANTFTDSLSRLTNEEQKAVKTTVVDLQMNPANPGLQLHKLDKAKDKNFWSVRVNKDIRIIVHRTEESLLICYVDHHDKAYEWAERRKMETHPKTGAAQIIEIRESVKEIEIPYYVQTEQPLPQSQSYIFNNLSEDELLKYGVPQEWLNDVKNATEESFIDLVDYLPEEAMEALMKIAIGDKPEIFEGVPDGNPFDHPDAQRRFRIMKDTDELARALEYPWEKWSIFLHPAQRKLVKQDYNGPFRVSGSAGTGKTVVALHRAVHLARTYKDARVLLTTFSDNLANMLRNKLKRLIHNEPRLGDRLEVHAIDEMGNRLYKMQYGQPDIIEKQEIKSLIQEISIEVVNEKFPLTFLMEEWQEVVDPWQVHTWEAYRDVRRLGRKTRLPEKQRGELWAIYEKVLTKIQRQNKVTQASVFTQLAKNIHQRTYSPYDYAIIDEAQDVSIPQLKFLASLGGNRPNSLFFAGDLGQRIFQQPFSWKALGVDIRGRSQSLKINYRTSHQIRSQADQLLDNTIADVDGNTENRKGTVSVFNGPPPYIQVYQDQDEEITKVGQWLQDCLNQGVLPRETGVFVRSEAEIERAQQAIRQAGYKHKLLDTKTEPEPGYISISTMHLAKGLEFKAVAVMACDDNVIPNAERIQNIADNSDFEDVYNTERNLLYVACTRARDHLMVCGIEPASEFLDDINRD